MRELISEQAGENNYYVLRTELLSGDDAIGGESGEGAQGHVYKRMENAGNWITVLIRRGHIDRPRFARGRRQLLVVQPLELVYPLRCGDTGDRREGSAVFVQCRQCVGPEGRETAVRRRRAVNDPPA